MILSMTPALALHAIAQYSASRIVDSLAGGTLVGMLAVVLLLMAHRQSAKTRFAVWFSALIGVAAVPFAAALWPQRFVGAIHPVHALITLSDSWALFIFGCWALVSIWLLLRVGYGVWHLYLLRRNCVPIAAESLHPCLTEILQRDRSKRLALCVSEEVRVPTAVGLFEPAIVLPLWAMQELSTEELKQILLHELAHLRRRDDWTNLAQQLIKALFFFHPAVLWIERKVALEREIACDDDVLAEVESPRAYAECLTHLAERSFVQKQLAMAQAALGRVKQMSLRLTQILDGKRSLRGSRRWNAAVALIAVLVVTSAVCISRAPRLVDFDSGVPLLDARLAPSLDNADRNASPELTAQAELRGMPSGVHVTQAELHTVDPAHRSAARARSAVLLVPRRNSQNPIHQNLIHQNTVHENLVHLTGAESFAVPISESVFVVVKDGEQIYQIQLWRVMIFQLPDPAGEKIPSKQT